MKKILVTIIVLLVIILGAWWLLKAKPVADPITTPLATHAVSYSCNGGSTIDAVLSEGAAATSTTPDQPPTPTGSAEVKLSDGRTLTLPQTISASGVRYANADESFVFWSKGNGALVLENNVEKSYIGCVVVAPLPAGSTLTRIYSNGSEGFSLRLPEGTGTSTNFTVDETFKNQIAPKKIIAGTKFTIPASVAEGTNLSTDSYLSVESIPQAPACTADLFFDGTHPTVEEADNRTTYSVASSTGAGAGNRYEETVYALPGTNPCLAVRYLVHYGVLQNYPAVTVTEFDKQALLDQFDQIRRTLVVNQ